MNGYRIGLATSTTCSDWQLVKDLTVADELTMPRRGVSDRDWAIIAQSPGVA